MIAIWRPEARADERRAAFRGAKVAVLGLGESGRGVSLALASLGAVVRASDQKPMEEIEELNALQEAGVGLHLGGNDPAVLEDADLLVLSPGISPRVNIAQRAQAAGVPVVSEVEVAWALCPAPIIAITGTNGKSTVASLVGHLLEAAGERAIVAGNIGSSLSLAVLDVTEDVLVVAEISSYQLETVDQFCPRVGVLLNITPDHLSRHGDMESYAEAKARLFARMTSEDVAVYNYDDHRCRGAVEGTAARPLPYSTKQRLKQGAVASRGRMVLRDSPGGRDIDLGPIDRLTIGGEHNLSNALAALAACEGIGADVKRASSGLPTFQPLEHRLERVLVARGVTFVNDSKATNVDATRAALESIDQKVIWIAGGVDKGSSYEVLRDLVTHKVMGLVCLGEAAQKIKSTFEDIVPAVSVASMREAVRSAWKMSQPGSTVLLAPACSSFDMFGSFEERGRVFKEEVVSLAQEEGL